MRRCVATEAAKRFAAHGGGAATPSAASLLSGSSRRWNTHMTHEYAIAHLSAGEVALRARRDARFRQDLLEALRSAESQESAASSTPNVAPSATVEAEPLTRRQWVKLFFRTAAPFFGFGICDNLIMITVGDLIDTHFGVTLGFSTMVAAGLGQACSDGAGITIQGTIEAMADKMGLPNPNLSDAQKASRRVLFWQQVFRTIGIITGCLCGLVPVIIWDTGNRPRLYDQLLSVLPEDKRKLLSAKAHYISFDEGDYIFTYGEEADGMYTIVTGEVRVIGRSDDGSPVEFCKNGPGENLGLLELVFNHPCVADVVATTPVKLLRIARHDFESCSGHDDIRQVVTKYIEEDDRHVVYRARHLKKDK